MRWPPRQTWRSSFYFFASRHALWLVRGKAPVVLDHKADQATRETQFWNLPKVEHGQAQVPYFYSKEAAPWTNSKAGE